MFYFYIFEGVSQNAADKILFKVHRHFKRRNNFF